MKNKKLFVKYKILGKVIQTVTLLSVVFLLIFGVGFSVKVYAQETNQPQETLLYKVLKIFFDGNSNTSTQNGSTDETGNNTDFNSGSTTNNQTFSINYRNYGFSVSPDPNLVTTLKQKIQANKELAQELLAEEEKLINLNIPVKPYLTTAWAWYETNQGNGTIDIYSQNCNDASRNITNYCPRPLFQVAGYQLQDRLKLNQFIPVYELCHKNDSLPKVLTTVFKNSARSTQSQWKYPNQTNNTFIQKNLYSGNFPSNLTIDTINPSYSNLFDTNNPQSQALTVLLGKDPCMVIGLNRYAVSDNDLIRKMRNNDKELAYVNKVTLASMVEALKLFDQETAPPDKTVGGTSSDIVQWAERISQNLQIGSQGLYNRMIATISNGTYTATKREGYNESVWYWCTYIVVDAVNLAGKKGLTIADHPGVGKMSKFWADNRGLGYNYVPFYSGTTIQKQNYIKNTIKPGCAFFQETVIHGHVSAEHVALVKRVEILNPSSGDGRLFTIESNNSRKEVTYPIDNWEILNVGRPYLSFGCFN